MSTDKSHNMILRNTTKKTILTSDLTHLTSINKVKGLIGEKNQKGVLFYTRFGIHTFFMQYPIDVIILTDDNMVVSCKKNMMPSHVFFWNPRYKKVIELPAGQIKSSQTQIGDMLQY